MDKNIGKKLDGRYEITELIGIGGMADVYKAIDIIEDKAVAVKILKNEFSNDEDFLRRFRNESKAIAVLSHPNIVKIFDVGFTEKIQFIVMEYIDGITLKEFMEQQGVLKWKDAIHFIIQILRALQHAHDRGIVHRDIKPQNIMLFPDGTIKVMDFGIARFAREEGKTLSDKTIGSVHYISPEQARGDFTDEKSDIYSVGVMLYEMLTGKKPFDADNPVSVAVMHMQTKARNPREINDTIPEGLEEIVMRAMQKDASKRYQSASEMIKDIEQFKKNPSIVFEYKYLTPQNEASTKYFKPVGARNERNDVRQKRYEYQDEIDDIDDTDEIDEIDEIEEEHKSFLVPILTAIAAAVVIVAVFFITMIVVSNFGGDEKESTLNMPNLVGMDYYEAKSQYEDQFDLDITAQEYSDYDKDVIFYQSIVEGREIKQGNTVSIKVSKGIKTVEIPEVLSYDEVTAKNMLTSVGLLVDVKYKTDDVASGYAISTTPEKGESVKKGDTVTLWISTGPVIEDVIVPDFVGKTKEEAAKLCETKNLTPKYVEKNSEKPAGQVLEQSIEPKEPVKPDTEITLTISTGVPDKTGRNIKVQIPGGSTGTYTFSAYINGEFAGDSNAAATVYDVEYSSQVYVPAYGHETQTVVIQIQNNSNGEIAKLAEFTVDFSTGKQTNTYYNYYAFSDTADTSYQTPSSTTQETIGTDINFGNYYN